MKSLIILGAAGLAGTAGGLLWAGAETYPQRMAERDAIEKSVHYEGCNEVRLLGKAPLYRGQPGYGAHMDGDSDGIACEPRY